MLLLNPQSQERRTMKREARRSFPLIIVYDSCSSDDDNEVQRLIKAKQSRLEKIILHKDAVLQRLEEEMGRPCDEV